MVMSELRLLIAKELRQMLASRGALWTALLLPVLFLLLAPLPYLLLAGAVPVAALELPSALPLAAAGDGPAGMLRKILLPLFMLSGGLLVPSSTATYTLIAEREQRTLELLVGLPVRISQVLLAKLLVVASVTVTICMALFMIDAGLILHLRIADLAYIVALGGMLLAALAFSITSALLIALLARDLRAANHLATALLLPTILVCAALLGITPGDHIGLWLIAGLLTLAASAALWIALRVITFERLLR